MFFFSTGIISYSSASKCYIESFYHLMSFYVIVVYFVLFVHRVFFTWSIKHFNLVVKVCHKVGMYSCSDVTIERNFLSLLILHGALHHNLGNVYI